MTRSVDRALALVEALEAAPQEGASLMELAERTGVDKSTVTRLLATCADRAWIVRDPVSRRYRLGPTLLAMARRGSLDDRVMIAVYEALTAVRDATGETTGFHRRAGDRRVAIAGVESTHDVRRGFNAGESCSLLLGPASKAILAFVPDEERSAILAAAPADVDTAEVGRHVAFLRAHHYLSTDGDRTDGVGAIATPVFDARGVAGSVTSSGPAARFDGPARERARTALFEAADAVTFALGGRRPRELT
ncbi:MAG TPA: helix-turn-helix domain-containing protein [Streptosporangiaceae bacterium]|jgi:DNA-binding IclR family transcriptional regulator